MYRYTYLIGDLLLAFVWLFFYFRRKDLRYEIITMSLLTLFWIGISFFIFAPDFLALYWNPEGLKILHLPLGVLGEDILYAFLLGGVAAVIYEEILGKTNFKKMRKQNHFIEFALFPIIIFISMLIGIKIIKINPLYTTYIGFLISALIILKSRRDLFAHSILSGLFLSIIYFFLGAFILMPIFPQMVKRWWYLQNLSGILIMGVPLEEIIWAFTFGLFIGPAYEFLMGLKDRRLPNTGG